jgi:hypothetical protein
VLGGQSRANHRGVKSKEVKEDEVGPLKPIRHVITLLGEKNIKIVGENHRQPSFTSEHSMNAKQAGRQNGASITSYNVYGFDKILQASVERERWVQLISSSSHRENESKSKELVPLLALLLHSNWRLDCLQHN